ncbi:EamA family transporter [Rossellomorea marisflavi]|uniref:EamA family transporter n=1 Tax=Rossellomorea marisflavi TaxID=189381 RepID=UPI0028534DB5|nr:EamA family transporter [Rossellomorea marisflavi]MDR4935024.1 EamA family transporter [Rossellomorea marisflavi]
MRIQYALFILLAAMLWGTTGTVQALAPEGVHPIAIGAVRLAIGGLFLLLLSLGKIHLRGWPVKGTVTAALCMALYQPFFFSAVSLTGIAIGTVIAIGSAPVIAGLLEWGIKRKVPQASWWTSTALAIAGCLLLFINRGSVVADPRGILLALGAGASFAGYTMISGTLVNRRETLPVVAVVFMLGAIFLTPFLFLYDLSWLMEVRGAGVALHLGVVATGLAYLLFARGLVKVPASTAVTLSLAEPLTATMLGVFLIGESLDALSWLGVGLLLLGIMLLVGKQGVDSDKDKGQMRSA